MQDWLWATAGDLGRGIARGEIDPEALCDTYLTAIRESDVADRIYCDITATRAHSEAAAAAKRARDGLRRGPLDGVPISWKDLFDSAGSPTEAGSKLLSGRVPQDDAEVLTNATSQGAVCLGKTHMSELAFSGLGLNPVTATPPNVHDSALVPGGSSSGAAASIAFGLAPLAIGSDTGGSVRIPAAWNDLVGLKTTHGRVSLRGVVPLIESFDTVGPLTRTVEDAALALSLLDRSKPVDLRGATLKGARLLALADFADNARDAPRAAYKHAEERFQDAGAIIERRSLDCVSEAMALSAAVFSPEAYATWGDTIEAAPHLMFDRILDRFRSGKAFSGPEAHAAWRKLDALRDEYSSETAGYDAVILPSSMSLPPDRERLLSDDDYYVEENLHALYNTRVGNLMGLCGLTLPTGVPSCGVMALCPPMAEGRLLRLGQAMEKALA